MNKGFIDLDQKIIEREGKTIPEIFSTNGEEYFRQVEKTVIKEIGKNNNLVIATGGGAVLLEENRKALKQNGVIIYLQRDVEKLISDGRPLSQKEGIVNLYEKRKGIYESFADYTIDCNGTIDKAVEEIIKLWKKF